MRFSRDSLFSPAGIGIGYFLAACVCILAFRCIFPGEIAPLPIFSRSWRLIQGLLTILALFPALAFSALVIPFGIASDSQADTQLPVFRRLTAPLITAIGAAGLYALLFFLILPLAKNYERNVRYEGEIYRLAKERAHAHSQAGEWLEVSQFIGICDSVWKDSPELTGLRAEVEIYLEERQYTGNRGETRAGAGGSETVKTGTFSVPVIGRDPVDVTDAIARGESALSEGRLLDAHWLATLGGRIAQPGSPEQSRAAQLAARAWNSIEAQQPTRTQSSVYSLYRQKLAGYEAMISGDWIRAYYIFRELIELTPQDPDVAHFLAESEKGTGESAFFIDEMEVSLNGETLTGTVFSLPVDQTGGQRRSVLRVSSLSFTPDYAYGIGIEYAVFDSDARPVFSLSAPYAKFLPMTLDGRRYVLVMMRTLDRHDSGRRWEPEWTVYNEAAPQVTPADAQIVLNVNYEDFVMLSEMRQGLSSLHISTLYDAVQLSAQTGYIPEVFEAEILNRLGACLFFLPMAVFVLTIGWRFRARQRPRYLFVLLLPVLPLIFNGLVYLYRAVINTVGISLILAAGFSTAFVIFIVIMASSFVLSLILLAAQRDKKFDY